MVGQSTSGLGLAGDIEAEFPAWALIVNFPFMAAI
jgi:hypothetical protein